jgi:hypothetical protein
MDTPHFLTVRWTHLTEKCSKGAASTAAPSAACGFMLGVASPVWAAVPGGDAGLPKGLETGSRQTLLVKRCSSNAALGTIRT